MSRSPLIEAGTSQTGNLLQFLAWLSERPAATPTPWKPGKPVAPAVRLGRRDVQRLCDTAHGPASAGSIIVLTDKGRALLDAYKGALRGIGRVRLHPVPRQARILTVDPQISTIPRAATPHNFVSINQDSH